MKRVTVALLVWALVLSACSSGPSGSSSGRHLNWFMQSPTTSPPARAAAAMAYDPGLRKLVLFGGQVGGPSVTTSSRSLGDTWTYDGKTWANLSPATSPPARAGAAMAYDEQIGKLVLFGGADLVGSPAFNDTWTFDGVTWTQQHPAGTSPLLSSAAMTYDPAIGKLVLLGLPAVVCSCTQTWTYDGSTWTQESPAGPVPGSEAEPGRGAGLLVYDSTLKQVVLYAPALRQTWSYDGRAWAKQPAILVRGPVLGPSMAHSPAAGRTVLFGGLGRDPDPSSHSGLGPAGNDTWIYSGSAWAKQSPSTAPTPRYNAAMADDPALDRLVLFGGEGSGRELADTWTYASAQQP